MAKRGQGVHERYLFTEKVQEAGRRIREISVPDESLNAYTEITGRRKVRNRTWAACVRLDWKMLKFEHSTKYKGKAPLQNGLMRKQHFSHFSQKDDLKTSELQKKADYNLVGFIALVPFQLHSLTGQDIQRAPTHSLCLLLLASELLGVKLWLPTWCTFKCHFNSLDANLPSSLTHQVKRSPTIRQGL